MLKKELVALLQNFRDDADILVYIGNVKNNQSNYCAVADAETMVPDSYEMDPQPTDILDDWGMNVQSTDCILIVGEDNPRQTGEKNDS